MNPVINTIRETVRIDQNSNVGYGSLQTTETKLRPPLSSFGKDNPFVPLGRHIRGNSLQNSLKKDRYKLDSELGQTTVDLGGLVLVKKKLDFGVGAVNSDIKKQNGNEFGGENKDEEEEEEKQYNADTFDFEF